MTRPQLLDAARHVCRSHGVAGMTMRRVADQAGVTAPAIYRHFPGKADILQALVDQANAQLAVLLDRAGSSGDVLQDLRWTYDAVVHFALTDPTAYDILFFTRERRDADLEPEARRSLNFLTAVARVEACQAEGRLRGDLDAVTVALTLWAQVHGTIALHLQGRFGRSPDRLRAQVRAGMDLVLAGLTQERS